MNKKLIFSAGVMFLFSAYNFWASGIVWVFKWLLSFAIYLLIFYVLYFWFKKIFKKEYMDLKDFSAYFIYRVSWFLVSITLLLWTFVYYYNNVSPFALKTHYMTNGEQEIVFQEMMHIGLPPYFEAVKENLKEHKENGFVLYFEGVKPWVREDASEKFNKAMWFEFDENLYANLSKLYGLEEQKNEDFLGIVNDKDFNVDISMDDIISEYEKIEDREQHESGEVIDINSEIVAGMAELSDRELLVFRHLNRAMMNFIYNTEAFSGAIKDNFTNRALFEVILDRRNDNLVDWILNNGHDKIFITYWGLHFEWVMKLLKENDPRWKVTKEEYLYPIWNK